MALLLACLARPFLLACVGTLVACGSSDAPLGSAGSAGQVTAGEQGVGGGAAGLSSTGGAGAANGGASSGGKAGAGGSAGSANGGAGGKVVVDLPPATGEPGVWEEVTSPEMDPTLFEDDFGIGNIVADPARPSDMYAGGYGSIWKSTDYGLTWKRIDSEPNPPSLALGHVLAVAGTTPATLFMANVNGEQKVFKSTDGGLTFTLTGTTEQPIEVSFYSIEVDPNDPEHLITGLHEDDKVLESNDGAETWHFVSGAGWPSGGKSWFPYFVNTGDAATTSKTWFAIAQDGGSAVMTTDGGANWVEPNGIEGLQHLHGNAGLYQGESGLFVAGIEGPGDGVYRSTDGGMNWTQVTEGSGGVVWGTPKNLYAMWAWACAGCGSDEGGPRYQTAPQPGTDWVQGVVPPELDWGPNSVAVSSDGVHSVFVGAMWATGLWRYVEP